MDKQDTKSGLGEFWDDWIEKDKQEKREIQELIEKRKQEAKSNDDSREGKSI